MAENKNNFDTTVASLFKGMDSFVSAKTVVGDAVTVNDTIILPLVDVSFGVGAGAFAGENQDTVTKILDMVPDVIDRFTSGNKTKEYDEEVENAIHDVTEE